MWMYAYGLRNTMPMKQGYTQDLVRLLLNENTEIGNENQYLLRKTFKRFFLI